jgi:hypothetical protein
MNKKKYKKTEYGGFTVYFKTIFGNNKKIIIKEMKGKNCTGCQFFKLNNYYYKKSKAPDRLRAKCKECLYFIRKNHRERNKVINSHLKNLWKKNPNYYK